MAKKSAKKKEESLVMVGPGADDEEEFLDQSEDSDDSERDEEDSDGGEEDSESRRKKPQAKSDEDEDGDSDEGDERVGHGEDDEEDDGDGRSNKRESRKARRERQRRARQRNETELNFLRQQNEKLEREVQEIKGRQNQTEAGSIDQRITSIQSQLKVADQVFAKAVANGDEGDIAEATSIKDRLRETLGRLNGAKQELTRRSEAAENEPQVDSKLIFHASQWMRSNNWYDPKGTDRDSRRVAAIDDRLVAEGYDPRSPDYWDELTDRVREALPHRFKDRRNAREEEDDDDDDDQESRGKTRRGSGPRFSTGGRERPLRKNEVYVSPERKQALIDAGVWEDPVLRTRYLKRYKEYDQKNGPGRSAR